MTHLQEHKTTVTTVSDNHCTVLLSAAIVEGWNRFECVVGGVRHVRTYIHVRTYVHVSGFTITHFQGHKTTVTTASGNHYTVLLLCFHDSKGQQYGVMVTSYCSYSCFVLLKMGDSETRNM